MSPSSPTVHVVDDDPSFRTALGRLLRAGGYDVSDYGSVATFLSSAPGDAAGCILSDLCMPEQGGLELQAALADSGNPIPIIFLTAYGDIPTTVRAVRDGAVDFLIKPVKKANLFDAIDRALAIDAAAREQNARFDGLHSCAETLTPREREVLGHVVAGKLNKQIAFELGTSERTVKAHRAGIVSKLQVRSVAELVRVSEILGIEPTP